MRRVFMSLNLFLPHLPQGGSGPEAARPGPLRWIFAKLGPTWLASPIRRVVQCLSLALFLLLLLYVCWPHEVRPLEGQTGWPSHYADSFGRRELVAAESLLALDPLVSISTALAARTWIWSLTWAALLLLICLLIPRGFCGYVCPLGTIIDLFDWLIGRRVKRLRPRRDGWWVHLRYYVLGAVLAASVCGVLLSGFVAAIAVVTRGVAYTLAPLGLGLVRGWHVVPPLHAGHVVSILLFVLVLCLGLLQPRFWCRHVCPSGAVFSLANQARLTDRKISSACIACGKCRKACPFDAIRSDFTTRPANCTFCQTCGGVCPVRAISFVPRWGHGGRKPAEGAPTGEIAISRRDFLLGTAVGVASSLGIRRFSGARLCPHPVRPPGSVPEESFLRMCVRCGECINACPSKVLQPMAFDQGVEGLWTPRIAADWSGCEPSCNVCGNVCPTGAIRALPIEEKRVARLGRAVVNKSTCLPHAQKQECRLCHEQCAEAGYKAIEFELVGVELEYLDDEYGGYGVPVDGTGYHAPVVIPERCVGCGLCQSRCLSINVLAKGLLREPAIKVEAGPGKEDRLHTGSYLSLRQEEQRRREQERQKRLERKGVSEAYSVPE